MENNKPKFVIIGPEDNINLVLNKLPNKHKLQYHYFLDVENPLIEYGFFLDREDEEKNIGEFNIIVCSNQSLLNKIEFNDIKLLIICHDNNYDITNKINAKYVIHIWFNTDIIPNNVMNKENHYLFYNNEWMTQIYNHLDIPYTPPNNLECNII
jgi:hypothetical protein